MLVNTLLVGVFAVQHTLMARPTFKKWWTRFVPRPIERATYVLFTNLALVLLFWQWRPTGGIVWDVQSAAGTAALYGLFGLFGLFGFGLEGFRRKRRGKTAGYQSFNAELTNEGARHRPPTQLTPHSAGPRYSHDAT